MRHFTIQKSIVYETFPEKKEHVYDLFVCTNPMVESFIEGGRWKFPDLITKEKKRIYEAVVELKNGVVVLFTADEDKKETVIEQVENFLDTLCQPQ